ncbi:hypothetical protein AB0J38_05380 [Streptomyces sp. NPDC050095]|uniref:hypothetical protein n=1 Tax=unclassified Streptomyces TaxID=2593676 RepID=UPI00344189D0
MDALDGDERLHGVHDAEVPYEPSPPPGDPYFKLRFLFAGQLDPDITRELLRTALDYRLAQLREPGWMDFTSTGLGPVPTSRGRGAHRPTRDPRVRLQQHRPYIAWFRLTLAKKQIAPGLPPGVTPFRGAATTTTPHDR